MGVEIIDTSATGERDRYWAVATNRAKADAIVIALNMANPVLDPSAGLRHNSKPNRKDK
jgi:glycine/D-amino acid oxidase-like deaminating enzyme